MIGAGDLIISSASEFGRQVFSDIRKPEDVQKTIYHQGELNSQRMFTGGRAAPAAPAPTPPTPAPTPPAEPPVAAPAPAAPSATLELERLAKLRADGVLTEEEFQAQKAKILGQG
jgi:hypothetical protein